MMGYCLEKIERPLSSEQIQGYEYALIYMISSVKLLKAAEFDTIDWEECQEARFFSEEKELHIFDTEDGKGAVLIKDQDNEDRVVKKYEIAPKFSKFGKTLKVIEYLSYDKDGQMQIALTRLAGIE